MPVRMTENLDLYQLAIQSNRFSERSAALLAERRELQDASLDAPAAEFGEAMAPDVDTGVVDGRQIASAPSMEDDGQTARLRLDADADMFVFAESVAAGEAPMAHTADPVATVEHAEGSSAPTAPATESGAPLAVAADPAAPEGRAAEEPEPLENEAGIVLTGTEEADTLTGTDQNDTINGLGGDDDITSGIGDDVVHAGDGNDKINVVYGNNTVYGGAGNDRILGGVGQDVFYGGDGDDIMSGRNGGDTIYGGNGNDRLQGGSESGRGKDDLLDGGAGRDRIYGQGGDDLMYGGADEDTIRGGGASDEHGDTIVGGTGDDWLMGNLISFRFDFPRGKITFVFSRGDGHDQIEAYQQDIDVIAFADPTISFEDLEFSRDAYGTYITYGEDSIYIRSLEELTFDESHFAFNYVIDGPGQDNVPNFGNLPPVRPIPEGDIEGTAGDDKLRGTDADEVIVSEGGNDTIKAGGGDDQVLIFDGGANTVHGGEGNDRIRIISDENQIVKAGSGDDNVSTRGGDDVIHGGSGDDSLNGGFGDDTIYGGAGDDLIYGGRDTDLLYGGGGNDRIIAPGDTVFAGGGNDWIRSARFLDAGNGDDTIVSAFGDDEAESGYDDRVLNGGKGDDVFLAGLGLKTLIGGKGDDLFLFGSFQDTSGQNIVLTLDSFDLIISDFNTGNDKLGFYVYDDIRSMDDLGIEVRDGNTIVTFGDDDQVTLQDYTDPLTEDDIMFFHNYGDYDL